MNKYETALVNLANGSVDTETWGEIASASPSTFTYWANAFPGLCASTILENCWHDLKFREGYKGDRKEMNAHLEEFSAYCRSDFEHVQNVQPFTNPKSAELLAKWYSGAVYGQPLTANQALRILKNFPRHQLHILKHCSDNFTEDVPADVVTKYLETTKYNSYVVTSLLGKYSQEEIQEWELKQFQDPVTAYVFGSSKLLKELDESDLRHLGYLSFYNLRCVDWHESFKRWLTRHGNFEPQVLKHFSGLEITRDLTDIDEDFFTKNRLRYLDRLMGAAEGIKLNVPSFVAIKVKEQILMNESEYSNLQDRVLAGMRDA